MTVSRDYFALPHEYLEEMADLTDEEFGRLIRAGVRYSMTGELGDLPGTERLFWVRVKNREDRYQANYDDIVQKRKVAAQTRWDRAREMQMHANGCNTNTNSNSKTNPYPQTNTRRSKERRDAAAAAYGESLKKDMIWLEQFSKHEGSAGP